MWLFNTILSVCFCLLLTACGFHPLYTSSDPNCSVSYPLKIATISERNGQILRNYLLDLLLPAGAPLKPKYTLEIKLTETILDTGILRDETTSRQQVTLTAAILLRDRCCRIVYNHCTSSINSFAVLSENYYSDSIAKEYAKKEALRVLAEKIKLLVSAYLDNNDKN